MVEGMNRREKVYLKDTALWGGIDHEATKLEFPEVYAKLDTLTHGSQKRLVWKCSSGHSWTAKIDNRSNGRGCPFCSGRRATDSNRLTTVRPDLTREWDFDKNEISPYDVSVWSHRKAFWMCSENHSWQAVINSRSSGKGCPFCSGRRTTDSNRLTTVRPDLAREWDFDKNELNPYDMAVSSSKRAWWVCSAKHSWRATIDNRSKGHGCPFCSGRRATDSNRLTTCLLYTSPSPRD